MARTSPLTNGNSGPGPGRRARACRAQLGFSFVEVLIATALVGTALVAATAAMTGAVRTQHALAGDPTTALELAREIHGLAMVLPRGPGDGSPATAGTEVLELGDLDGATFTPPIDANLASRSGDGGWSQDVSLSRVDLDSPDALAATADGDDALVRLTVVVRLGAAVQGTYTWWINP